MSAFGMFTVGIRVAMACLAAGALAACVTEQPDAATAAANLGADPTRAGDHEVTLRSGGIERGALVHVPASYDRARPTMLVLDFHGITMTAEEQVSLSGMNAVADAENFLVVYPRGIDKSWNAGPACCGGAQEKAIDDVRFVRDLLDHLATVYAVDAKRVYATGMSNGGFFTHRLGCELADRIAAIAPVAGVMGIAPDDCKPSRAISVLDFHGTEDWVVPYDSSDDPWAILFGSFVSAPTTMATWRARSRCGTPRESLRRGKTVCETATCDASTEVTFCTSTGAGHSWPGSRDDDASNVGAVSHDVNASRMIHAFFAAHPMP